MSDLYLIHSKKGETWAKHKYIKKVGNRYIYSKDGSAKDNKTGKEIDENTKDEDIIRNSLGEDFDSIQQLVIAKQKETGRTDLTNEEIKEILGDKYEEIQKRILEQAEAREERKKTRSSTTKKKTSSTSSKKKTTSKKSSKKKTSAKHSFENDDFLAHHGIIGQRWGIRRYQNRDGSLTSEGKQRYRTDGDKSSSKSSGKNSKNVISTSNSVNSISKDASKVNNSIQKIRNNKKNIKSNNDISKMTDEELRKRVNRLNMEKQYRDLTGTGKVLKGQDYVREALEIVGGIAGITGSAVMIYTTLKGK